MCCCAAGVLQNLLYKCTDVPCVSLCAAYVRQVIFHHYVKDLEAVQAQYEAFKHKPPVARNMPPIAGNIMWSRQLLRRIEEPMQHFAQNKALMAMKESKKVIKMYNRVSTGSKIFICRQITVAASTGISQR